LLTLSLHGHPGLPLTRELSAKLTEGETFAPNDPHTHKHRRNFGQYPNCRSSLSSGSWHSNHWSAVHLFLPVPMYSALRRQVQSPVSLLHNKSPQYSFQSLFAFENAPDSFIKNHTTVFAPKGSYSFATPWPEGYSLCCRLSWSLPPSKIKDFCHLPHQREALVQCKPVPCALHRTAYRNVLLIR